MCVVYLNVYVHTLNVSVSDVTEHGENDRVPSDLTAALHFRLLQQHERLVEPLLSGPDLCRDLCR